MAGSAVNLHSLKHGLANYKVFQSATRELLPRLLQRSASASSSGHVRSASTEASFALMFDIDGVLVRGKKVLPPAVEAFHKLTDKRGKFRVPAIFVTNAGNSLRSEKAAFLSECLGVKISENQVVMAHSPLKMFKDFHSKTVLVSGQGPVVDIAKNIGFSRIVTVDDVRQAFPVLDAVDQKRRKHMDLKVDLDFPTIDAVVLFGEPVNWETSLQLLLDVLMTDGKLTTVPRTLVYPHLPILACNMDLQWMAEAWLPRFGHGAFLLCLEELYKKVTGKELKYTALIGKPSELTFHHAEHIAQQHAKEIGLPGPVKKLYFVGDNLDTDIFGANLYNRYLKRNRGLVVRQPRSSAMALTASQLGREIVKPEFVDAEFESMVEGADECFSILVQTGVSNCGKENDSTVEHSPRDFLPVEEGMREPAFVVEDVHRAVELVLQRESFPAN